MPKRKSEIVRPKREIEEDEREVEKPSRKRAKGKVDKPAEKKSEGKKLMNKTETDYSKLNFDNDKVTASGGQCNLKISSWNVDGMRAWLKKGGLKYLEEENPHILCLQETKCSEEKLPPDFTVKGYHSYWCSGEKEGYAGVALFSKNKPMKVSYGIGVEDHDGEGRAITAEYENFYLVTTYVPNAGRGLVTLPKRLSWDVAFRDYLKSLDSVKPVILCGDMNVSHKEIDLANPKTNTKNAGFTKEEREGMTELLAQGYIDTFRHFYPEETGAYTFWTYMSAARSRNVGWRLDYFIVSERIIGQICDSVIRSEVLGSDHCPIVLFLHDK